MNKIESTSLDLEKLNVERIKELFPNVVTEGKIDFDKLKIILGDQVDDRVEKYQFTWNGKSSTIKLAQSPSTGTLIPSKDDSKNWDTTGNLYIEGDNLEVLKQLQKTYYGKIKMIYIDPPYNTGGDFVYKDDFKDNIQNYKEQTQQNNRANPETNGRYHTDWLNMMYSRLMLAKNLLTQNGVIFISIDDNEDENLSKICNEIFGDNNFIGKFVVNSTPNARDYGHIGKMHEYVLFYSKSIEHTTTSMIADLDRNFKYNDNRGGFNIHPLYNSNVAFTNKNRPNLYYPFYVYIGEQEDDFYRIGLDKKSNSIEVYPPKSVKDNVQFVWRWGKEKASQNLNTEIIGYKVNDEYRIVQKMRHSEKLIRSLLIDTKYSSRRGTAEVEKIFQNKLFSFPKPIGLLYDLIIAGSEQDSIILDFFSGSSTTAHAVMQLNAEDGGNRKFIMVQLPELTDESSEAYKAGYKNICEIGKERIRRAGEQIKQELIDKKNKAGLLDDNIVDPETFDNGFKVFKLESTNIIPWDGTIKFDEDTIFSQTEVIKEDRTSLDVLYEIMLKYGVFDKPVEEIKVNGKTMYSIAKGYLIVCLDNNISLEDVKEIGKLKPRNVIFKESGFRNDNDKINATYTLEKLGVEEVKSI
ncbi:MAG: site-specific DNA-methyltransferase [Firmicutes bacterium]|nr:site-specific DNA-methyltransferase [Bacillota bacterium]